MTIKTQKISIIFAFSVVLWAAITGGVCAQEANIDRATREVDRLGSDEEIEKLTGRPPEAPPKMKIEKPEVKKEGEKFFIKKINLEGTESFPPEEFKTILEKCENRDVTLDELNALAKEIEGEYLKRGIISACFIPPQDIKQGVITFQVIEARMGELDIDERKEWYFNKDMVKFYWTVKPDEILSYNKISRSLYRMNKNPDRPVRATLHAGKKPGTTGVLLNVAPQFPVHITASYDREGAVTTGKERKGFGVKHNNFLFTDDTFTSGYTYGEHFSGIYAYHKIPITNSGTSFMYGYSSSKSIPDKDFRKYGIDARSLNATFYVYQDIFEKANYLGEIYGGLDFKDKSVKRNNVESTGGTTTRDRLRILKLAGNFVTKSPMSVVYITPEFSQGLNLFGSKTKTSLSSRNAGNTFSKFNFGARHSMVWPFDLQTNVNFRSQLSSEKLMPQEELDLGGIDSVRGYPWGDFQADNGLQVNLELLIPAFFIPKDVNIPYVMTRPLKDYFTGLLFFDYGYGTRRGFIEGEKSKTQMVSVGAGIRVKLLNQGILRMEWGFPIGDKPNTEGAEALGRFHFSIDLEDRLPEEMERIKKMLYEENIRTLAWGLLDKELTRPSSRLRMRLDTYRYLAEKAYEKGDYKTAKKYYSKVYDIGTALYQQSEEYVRNYIGRKKELLKDNDMAMQYYKRGEMEKAREIWLKIIKDAETKPLVVKF